MRSHSVRVFGALIFVASLVAPVAASSPAGAAVKTPTLAEVKYETTCTPTGPNQTVAFNAWLVNNVRPGDTVELPANKCYVMNKTVLMTNLNGVTFKGMGSTFKSFNDHAPAYSGVANHHLQIQSSTNLTVNNLNIVGAYNGQDFEAPYEHQSGIYIFGNVQLLTLYKVTVNHVWGDYVTLQQNVTSGFRPSGVFIQTCNFGGISTLFNGAGRMEIAIDDVDGLHVTDTYFGHGNRSAVDIEPTSSGSLIQDVEFLDNQFGPNHLTWFANAGKNATIRDIAFTDNTVNRSMSVESVPCMDNSLVGCLSPSVFSAMRPTHPEDFKRTNYTFLNNHSSVADTTNDCASGDIAGNQMRFWGVYGVTILGNTQPSIRNRCQIFVTGSHLNATIRSNTLQYFKYVGYYTSSSVCEMNNLIGPVGPGPAAPPSPQSGPSFGAAIC